MSQILRRVQQRAPVPPGRAELALAELDRTGAFDRSFLLLVAPTGTGWVPWQGSNPHHALARQSPSRRSLAWWAVTAKIFPSTCGH